MKKNQNKKLMQFERYFRKNHILSIMAYLITIMSIKKERLSSYSTYKSSTEYSK